MAFCLLPEKVKEFKDALKDRDIKVRDLINMDTASRTKLLEQYAGENAADVNRLFEEKLVLKNRTQGLKNWISKVGQVGRYSKEKQAEIAQTLSDYRAKQQERIFNPKENEAYLSSLVEKKLGTEVPREVAKEIFDRTTELQKLKNKNIASYGVSPEYLKARNDLEDYKTSLIPVSDVRSSLKSLATIGRNNLIASPATPIKAGASQLENLLMDKMTRRLGTMSAQGAVPKEIVSGAYKDAKEAFDKTGNNVAAMTSMDDRHIFNKGESFTTAKEGRGKIASGLNKIAAASNKVVIDWGHNYVFTKVYQRSFYDAANVFASKLAEGNPTKAETIFKDAVKIEPETPEGKQIRQQAQEQAARVTSTNDTWMSSLALTIKQALNKTGMKAVGFPVGDFLVPMAKIPSTVIANSIENAGGGFLGFKDIFQGRAKMEVPETKAEGVTQYSAGLQKVARTVGTLGLAALLTNALPTQNYRKDNYGQSFIKIGDTWINLEYLAPLKPAIDGMMAARQAKGSSLLAYGGGALEGVRHMPGVNEINNLVTEGIKKYGSNFLPSRIIPAAARSLFKDRPVNRIFFGAHGVESQAQVNEDTRQAAIQKERNKIGKSLYK